MIPDLHSILLVIVMAVVTALLRFFPFLVFTNKQTPRYIVYLGRVLPFAVMGMLVVYCLKDISFLNSPFGIPELVACLLVALMHIWRRNTLLSILTGTVSYMLMVQLVF